MFVYLHVVPISFSFFINKWSFWFVSYFLHFVCAEVKGVAGLAWLIGPLNMFQRIVPIVCGWLHKSISVYFFVLISLKAFIASPWAWGVIIFVVTLCYWLLTCEQENLSLVGCLLTFIHVLHGENTKFKDDCELLSTLLLLINMFLI